MAIAMKSAALLTLACLLLAHVEGQGGARTQCYCKNTGGNGVNPKLVEKMEVFAPSIYCAQMEVMVTLKNSDTKCLDPESKFVKNFMARKAIRNKSPVSTTPAMPSTLQTVS